MSGDSIKILISMASYMLVVIGIGVYFAKRANQNSEEYFIGGRSLGPWVAAMSAEASDMSGWLLMGLPGVAYWFGIADAFWTALGLAVGTYVNWLIVAKRLRRYSVKAGNAITLPDFFSNRYKEDNKIIMLIAALFILVFFSVYAASCFVTCGKLFSTLFGGSYVSMMIVGAVFVLLYTILGGFLAESASDFMQAIVMVFALVCVLTLGTVSAGGLDAVIENAKSIPGLFELTAMGNPSFDGQAVTYGEPSAYGAVTILSTLSWGLGYFGMPQVLLRFMAIRSEKEITSSRRIATVWVVISLAAAVMIGIVGNAMFMGELTSSADSENIFILMATNLLPPIFAGLVMAGILAATISSSDSYLLIAASAFAKNIYQGIMKKDANEKQVMNISRLTLLVIAIAAMLMATDEDSVIFTIVSFAWAGFGATFGPIMLFSLFWKRTTRAGAIAGMLGGGSMVFIWEYVFTPMGRNLGISMLTIYELGPAFLFSCLCIVVVSLLTKAPSAEIQRDFEEVKAGIDC